MHRRFTQRCLLSAVAIAVAAFPLVAGSPGLAAADQAPVTVEGRTLFDVTSANGMSSADRAALISKRLEHWIASAPAANSMRIELQRRGPVLMLGDDPLVIVTPEDAQANGSSPDALANAWKKAIVSATPTAPATPDPASVPENGWGRFRHVLALAAMILGGAIASWLVSWGTARVSEQPERYGLKVSSAAVTVTGGLLTFAMSLSTIAASLAYLPIHSLPLEVAALALGAVALIASSELLGNLAGGAVIAWTPLFGAGDYVRIGGHAGRVQKVGVCFTRLETERHGERLVPNSSVLRRGVAFTSPSSSALLSVPVRLAYTVQRDLAQAIIVEAALRTQGLVDEPFPECFLASLEEEVVRFELRAWIAKGERAEAVKSRFHVNLLDVLAENELGPTGAPLPRATLRIGMAPSNPEFPSF